MPLPEKPTPHYLKDSLDLVIENTASKDGPITQSDLNRVRVAAQILYGIEKYRAKVATKTTQELLAEDHSSARLASHLVEVFGARPPQCHAHAIVAGKHKLCGELRLLMAKLKIGIDDVDNGCWLPENTVATPHPTYPKAPPHSRIHRFNYYVWIYSKLSSVRAAPIFRINLNLISKMLQTGQIPESVMMKKGAAVPPGAFKK